MKIEEIRELAQIMKENGLGVLELQEDGTSLRLETACATAPVVQAVVPAAAPAAPAPAPTAPATAQDGTPVDFNNLKEVKSPMVGMFYQAPSPAAPYVRVGSKVKKGDVLCVIEAMKLLNEITADTDGEIVDVCVENGQLVEYGQVLFKIF